MVGSPVLIMLTRNNQTLIDIYYIRLHAASGLLLEWDCVKDIYD